ncbi:MAG TPA: hypothetical protein VKB62_01380 [Streptosporangiaceae bacterium]|nr:hypothetical protein [Streptosporangiaceae bacterium]
MPSRRQPASRSQPAGASRRTSIAAVLVVVAICLVIGLLAIKLASKQPRSRPTACVVGPANQAVQLSISQAGIAATIAGVASHQGMPVRAVAIAYATALQESKLANLQYGDQDSLGVFQQRPSQGWGTARQIENPVYASGRFFAVLATVPRYRRLPIYQAAQDVQRSADGSAYAQYAGVGTELARAFTGAKPNEVWCSYGSPVRRAQLAAARTALDGAFGRLGDAHGDPAGRVSVSVSSTRQGWAVAAWLVSHAARYGISDVRYAGFQWLASSSGRWKPVTAAKRGPAATAVVEFG